MRQMLAFLSFAMMLGAGPSRVRAEQPIWLVFDIDVRGLKMPRQAVDNLSEYLSVRLAERGLKIVPREERLALMASRKQGACRDTACQDELARALGAQRILSPRVLKMVQICKVTAQVRIPGQVVAEGAASAGEGCGEKDLLQAFDELVFRLAYVTEPGDDPAQADAPDEAALGPEPSEGAKAGTGTLSLTSRPAGRVWIDGRDSGQDTPLVDYPLPAGKHQLTIRGPNASIMRTSIEIWPDEATSLSMGSNDPDSSLAHGWLAVNTRPWSEVAINGELVGMTPLRQRLSVGKHEVKVVFPHGEIKSEQVQIQRGRTSRLVFVAEADRGIEFKAGMGLLKLNASPWGRIWIDGKDRGKATPLFQIQLKEGKHRVTIYFSTGGFMSEEVQIRAGEVTRKIIREKQP